MAILEPPAIIKALKDVIEKQKEEILELKSRIKNLDSELFQERVHSATLEQENDEIRVAGERLIESLNRIMSSSSRDDSSYQACEAIKEYGENISKDEAATVKWVAAKVEAEK